MRVLFLTASAKTHLYGMVPLAWALRAAGHDVRVAAATDPNALTADDAAWTGLPFVAVGSPVDLGAMARAGAKASHALEASPGPSVQSTQTDYVEHYLQGDPTGELALSATAFRFFCPQEATEDLIELAIEWRADLIVWDYMMMFGGPVAAWKSGAAHARFVYGVDAPVQLRTAWRARPRAEGADPLEAALTEAAAAAGRDFDEEMVLGQWAVNNMPPWTWRPAGTEYLTLRPLPFNGPAVIPSWVRRPSRPRVCLTLGLSTRDVASVGISFEDLFDAVSDLDAEIVATVGGDDTTDLPRVPDNVRLVGFVPMNALLPTCSAVIHHGGSQTVAAALEYGVPQLIVPSTFGNQRWWGPVAQAESLDRRKAGIYLGNADHVTAEALRTHLVRMLEDRSFRTNSAALRDELVRMPTPADVVPVLEMLTARHRGS